MADRYRRMWQRSHFALKCTCLLCQNVRQSHALVVQLARKVTRASRGGDDFAVRSAILSFHSCLPGKRGSAKIQKRNSKRQKLCQCCSSGVFANSRYRSHRLARALCLCGRLWCRRASSMLRFAIRGVFLRTKVPHLVGNAWLTEGFVSAIVI